jgi:hypothetical protein
MFGTLLYFYFRLFRNFRWEYLYVNNSKIVSTTEKLYLVKNVSFFVRPLNSIETFFIHTLTVLRSFVGTLLHIRYPALSPWIGRCQWEGRQPLTGQHRLRANAHTQMYLWRCSKPRSHYSSGPQTTELQWPAQPFSAPICLPSCVPIRLSPPARSPLICAT